MSVSTGPRWRWAVVALLVVAVLFGTAAALVRAYPYPYRTAVQRAAKDNGLDPYLILAVIRVESKFDPLATSRAGARGLMQVLPETGVWAASRMNLPELQANELYNPETNIAIGSWYLAELKREFRGNLIAALASYNGGRSNVRDWIEAHQWDGTEASLADIPFGETRVFVARVLRDEAVYRWLYGRLLRLHGR